MATEPKAQVDAALAGGGQMGALLRAKDWSQTSLGPVEQWPQSLKTSVSICLNSRFPVLIWWGPDLVKIYNDAYVPLIGTKHPGALGSKGRDVWPEIWETISPLLSGVLERGEATWADDLLLPLHRDGYSEECYFTFSYSPIRDESGGVGGVFTPVMETTEEVIGNRRLRTLRDMAVVRSHRSHSVREACEPAAQKLSANPYDLPFVAIYLFEEGSTRAELVGSGAGIDLGIPSAIELDASPWQAAQGLNAGESRVVPVAAMGLRVQPMGPGDTPVKDAMVVAVSCAEGEPAVGFLLAGINPHKRVDARYASFFGQIAELFGDAIREARMVEREAELVGQREAERAKLRELFQQAPAAMMMLEGPEHLIVLSNARYVRLVGRKRQEDLVGKTVAEALPEVVDQGFIGLLDEVYRTGVPFIGNEMMARLQREESGQDEVGYFNFVYLATRNGAGEIEGILIHVVEVTEQVRDREEVEVREAQFRVLADSIPQMAWMADPSGAIFWYNRRWYEYTGTTPDAMRGWGWQSVHDPERMAEVLERYKVSLSTGEPFSMIFPLRGVDGEFRNFLTLALPVRDSAGEIVRWVGTNTDVESQRKTEEALRQSEKLAVVGRLAASIAHEINNPLEAVTNLIYLAANSESMESSKVYLESAESELARVAQITSQTLRFHKQQSAPVQTDVVELVNTILALHRGKQSKEKLDVKLETRPMARLLCYAGEIRQVLANLVGNGFDAMPYGGRLRIRTREATRWGDGSKGVRIVVADTGHGMSATTLKRLYEPFFTTKETHGTGLGLWVSEGIVKKHGGTIRVRSRAGSGRSGTVFSVFLPYEAPDEA